MKSLLYQANGSTVQHIFQYSNYEDLCHQLDEAVNTGKILFMDKTLIHGYLGGNITHLVVNHVLSFEVTDVDCEGCDCTPITVPA